MKVGLAGNLGQQGGVCDYLSHKVEGTLDQREKHLDDLKGISIMIMGVSLDFILNG